MNDTIRIWRSPRSAFGHFLQNPDPGQEETVTALDAYTDQELAGIAASGFNAIWVHGNLNHVVRTEVFPELGPDAALHQQRLNALVERAGGHGIQVFLFCQPPRGIPRDDAFWGHHPDVAGQWELIVNECNQNMEVLSLCTSTDKVKQYLYQAAAELARKVPGLGGLILITASEMPAHCWSRRGRVIQGDGSFATVEIECPRCARRKPEAVVSEVIQLVRDGVRSVTADWKIIAWNWSWTFYLPSPCEEIIAALPKDVVLMVDFERGGCKVIAGKERIIDEYSLSYAGPSEQFMGSLTSARDHGIAVMAKLQFGTTHELATVPNLPVMGNVFAKADAVRKLGLSGFMGCWCFGNMITANTTGFNAFLSGELPDQRTEAMRAFAAQYFLGCEPDGVAAAWLKFGEAMDNYPFSLPYLYSGPTNFAFILPLQPGPLTGKPVGPCHMLSERGDDMGSALGDYSIEEIITGFERLAELWTDGLQTLRAALRSCQNAHALAELDTAAVCWHSFRSTANFCKVYRLRRQWDDSLLAEYQAIIRDEVKNLRDVLPILRRDPRFGYHIEAHGYQYDADSVAAKIDSLEAVKENRA
jgi:hypothetical protein